MPFLPGLPTHILCVEEDSYYIKLFEYLFKAKGSQWSPYINHVQNGEDALRFLHEGYYRNFEVPDLILLDIDMIRDNGFEVLRKLKENSKLKDIPIIALSFSDSGISLAKSILLGANGFVIKPADYKRLVPLIQAVWCEISASHVNELHPL